MIFVVIGLGSMGKRRIRLLHKICQDYRIIGVDGRVDRREEAKEQSRMLGFEITTYSSINDICNKEEISAAIISTSPLSHALIIKECLSYGWNVFTELNLVDDLYEENIQSAAKNGTVLYLSSTPLFRAENKYIISRVHETDGKMSYIYHVGQYLPDWHPWESYKDFFIGDKRTNGCREILAVELPWLICCFGEIESIKVNSLRQTGLDIDFNDNYSILVKHKNGNSGVIVADVVCRKAVRYFEAYGESLYLSWNGTVDSLKKYDLATKEDKRVVLYDEINHQEGYNTMIIENSYEEELRDFISVMRKEKEPEYSFEKDMETLRWIDEVEKC